MGSTYARECEVYIYVGEDDTEYRVTVETHPAERMTRDYPGCEASWEICDIQDKNGDSVEEGDIKTGSKFTIEELVQNALEAIETPPVYDEGRW